MRQRQTEDAIYRRPGERDMLDGPEAAQAYDQPVYDQRPVYGEPPYEEPPYYGDDVPQEELPPLPKIIATNRTVLLTCLLSAFCSPLALFFLFVEKRSRAIRHVSVQSLGVSMLHLGVGAILLVIGLLLGMIPLVGFLMSAVCWVLYAALIVVCVALRVRLMRSAYRGEYDVLPLIGQKLAETIR